MTRLELAIQLKKKQYLVSCQLQKLWPIEDKWRKLIIFYRNVNLTSRSVLLNPTVKIWNMNFELFKLLRFNQTRTYKKICEDWTELIYSIDHRIINLFLLIWRRSIIALGMHTKNVWSPDESCNFACTLYIDFDVGINMGNSSESICRVSLLLSQGPQALASSVSRNCYALVHLLSISSDSFDFTALFSAVLPSFVFFC